VGSASTSPRPTLVIRERGGPGQAPPAARSTPCGSSHGPGDRAADVPTPWTRWRGALSSLAQASDRRSRLFRAHRDQRGKESCARHLYSHINAFPIGTPVLPPYSIVISLPRLAPRPSLSVELLSRPGNPCSRPRARRSRALPPAPTLPSPRRQRHDPFSQGTSTTLFAQQPRPASCRLRKPNPRGGSRSPSSAARALLPLSLWSFYGQIPTDFAGYDFCNRATSPTSFAPTPARSRKVHGHVGVFNQEGDDCRP